MKSKLTRASTTIREAISAEDLSAIRQLFEEYAGSLGIDLSYQGFTQELYALPAAYGRPGGRLIIALVNGTPAGCVALRRHEGDTCEMKRLYVRLEQQGQGLGRQLAERAISDAQVIGYAKMLLDTLPSMKGALKLYESLGFVRRAPYFDSPIAGNVFMERRLGR